MAEQKKKKSGIFAKAAKSIRDTRGEMKKVVWPTRSQTIKNTGIVLVFMGIMAVFISLLDTLLVFILRLMTGA